MDKIKIAVNTRLLIANKLDGIGYFAHEVLSRWAKNHPEIQFFFLFDRTPDSQFVYADNVTPVVLYPQARHPVLYYTWFHIRVAKWLDIHLPDAFFSPEGYLSYSKKVPQFSVIHDLNFEHHPEDLPKIESWYYKRYFPKYAYRAKHIFTVSEFSKSDIVNQYHIPSEKITAVYNGIRSWFCQVEHNNKFKNKYTDGNPFLLHVGTLHPRKNIETIVASFNWVKANGHENLKLVFAGRKKWWTQSMENAVQKSPFVQDIVFTDRLETEDLVLAYNEAKAVLLLSYFEGFGLPLIEAMACGSPVITTKSTALEEVADKAALYVPIDQPEEIGKSILDFLNNSDKQKSLVAAGLERCKTFSWNTASETLLQEILKRTEHVA